MEFFKYISEETKEEILKEGFFDSFNNGSYIIDKNKYNSEISKLKNLVNKVFSNSSYKEIKKGVIVNNNPDVWKDDWDHIGKLNSRILNNKPIKNQKYRIELVTIKFSKCFPGKDYFQYGDDYDRGDLTEYGEKFDELTDESLNELEKICKKELEIFTSYDISGDGDYDDDNYIQVSLYGFLLPIKCKKEDNN